MVRCLRSWHYIHQLSLFLICSLSSCMCTGFSLCPSCGLEETRAHKFPATGSVLGCVWGAGRKGSGPVGAEITQEERREQDALHAAWPLWCGFMEEECHWDETGSEQRLTGRSLSNQLHVKLSDFGDVPGLPIPTIFCSSLCDLQLCVHLSSLKCSFSV